MISSYSRLSFVAFLCALATLILVLAPSAGAKKAQKSKKVKLAGKVVAVKGSKLAVKSKGKRYTVRVGVQTELAGRDDNDDGALDTDDIGKGDAVIVEGVRKGSQVNARNISDIGDDLAGDDDGDGLDDDVDTEPTDAVVDDVNLDQEVISVTVLRGPLAGQQMIVEVSGAVLVTGDRNKDSKRSLEDFAVGDQLKLILLAPVNPDNPQALVVIDKTTLGQAKKGKRSRGGLPVVGVVSSVDGTTGQVVIVPSVDGVNLPAVTFLTNQETKFEIFDSNQDDTRNVLDISVGQELKAILRGSGDSLVATKVEDEIWEDSEGRPEGDDDYQDQEVRGLVTAVDLAGKSLTIADPRSGATRTITFDASTEIRSADNNQDGHRDAADIVVGAKIEAVLDNNNRAIRLAVHSEDVNKDDNKGDDNKADDNKGDDDGDRASEPKPPAALVWKGRVTTKSESSLAVRIDGGPAEGQVLTATVDAQTLYFVKYDANKDGKRDLLDISAGDEVVVTVNNTTDKKAVTIFADND